MATRATSRFEIKGWDEKPYDEAVGRPKLTRASVTQSYSGDLEGEGVVEYLMVYRDDSSASIVSQERVVGRIGDRVGSFVLHGTGSYEAGVAQGTFTVVPGSGTDQLQSLRGQGSFIARQGDAASQQLTLDYDFG